MSDLKEGTGRPDINPEWSFAEKLLQIVCLLLLVTGVALLIASWGSLPASVPTHFNAVGTPDSYGAKSRLMLLPFIEAGLYLMLTVFERFPRIFNFPIDITAENARYEYQTGREMTVCLKTEVTGIFTYMLWRSVETAKGVMSGMGRLFLIVTLALIAVTMTYYIIRMVRHKDGK
jgi:uncharacterized membrane protein